MRSITATWFECKVQYDKMQENGLIKKITEKYVVNAMSFAEAEERVTEEITPHTSCEFEVVDVKKAPYKEVIFEDDPLLPQVGDLHWYKAKLQFIIIDEKTEKEKHSNVIYLVQGRSLHNALDNIDSVMKGTMIDYVQANVGETPVLDVFEFVKVEEKADEQS